MAKDFEGAAAFLNDFTPWKDKSDGERKEWQKRARALLDGNTRFGKYTNVEIEALSGIPASRRGAEVSARLSWSPAESEADRAKRERETRKRYERAVRQAVKDDPEAVLQTVTKVIVDAPSGTQKDRVKVAKSLLKDPVVAAAVVDDTATRRTIVKAEAQRPTRHETPEKTKERERGERESAAQVDAEYGPLLGAVVGLNAIPLVALGAEFLEGLEEVNAEEGTIGKDLARALDSIIRRSTEEVEALKFRSELMEEVR